MFLLNSICLMDATMLIQHKYNVLTDYKETTFSLQFIQKISCGVVFIHAFINFVCKQ